MGNAVRLTNKNADRSKSASQPIFCVPRGANGFVTNSTVSGKKIQMSEKGESSKVKYSPSLLPSQFSNKPSPELQGKIIMADYQKLNLNDTKCSSLFATAGQNTVQKIENSRQIVFPQGDKTQTTTESPKTEVRYIVLQPGQKMSDLLPLTSGQETGHNANQPHLVYLGHLKTPPLSTSVFQPPNSHFTKTDNQLPHPVASAPSLCPPVRGSDSDNDLPTTNNRPKDVVPGTEDKYRTPGSSFLNKKGNIKRPMNAFMVWARNYRSKLASRYHGDTNSQISIKLGDVWNSLTPEEKQPFYEEAERIKNQHRKEFPGWVYRPSITKKRPEEPEAQQAHQMLWARFAGGSSSATLAAMATAAANQSPLQSVHVKPELLPLVPKQQVPVDSKPNMSDSETQQPTKLQGQTEEKQTSTFVEQTALERDKGGQTKGQPSTNMESKLPKPTISTQEVLKAKLYSQSLPKPQIIKGPAESTASTKSSPKTSKKQPKSLKTNAKQKDQKQSLKGSKERAPRNSQGKKKKTSSSKGAAVSKPLPGIQRKEGTQCNLDSRSRSPVTPPSTPRTSGATNGPEDPIEAVEFVNRVTLQLGTESQSASDWADVNCTADDNLVRSLIHPEFSPFTSLSPRDVPSDNILGTGRRAGRGSESEDLSRPERVTSDIYLDLDSWSSYLTASQSASKLTDDDVCKMFDPKKCKHGEACTVCKSDIDLAPKPVSESLQVRRDPAQPQQEVVLAQSDKKVKIKGLDLLLNDPNVCVEVDVVERKQKKSDNVVDEIAESVYRTLIGSCDGQGTFNKPPSTSDSASGNVSQMQSDSICVGEQKQTDSPPGECTKVSVGHPLLASSCSSRLLDVSGRSENASDAAVQNAGHIDKTSVSNTVSADVSMEKLGESCESEETSVAMDTDSELEDDPDSHGVRFVDVTLSTNKSTHVVYKGDHSDKTIHKDDCTEPNSCSTCIGCSLNINYFKRYQDELNNKLHKSTPSVKKSVCFQTRARSAICRSSAPTIIPPTSKQVFKTENFRSDDSDSPLAPEVIPLTRSMDSESRSRCEMYHRKIEVPTDISKYRIFNTNRSAKSGSRRLKSAQLVRNGDSMELGVFGEEIVGQSISCGNMAKQPVPVWRPVEIDELDSVEGTGIQMEPRSDTSTESSKDKKLSPRKSGSSSDGVRHFRGRKKMARSSVTRVSDESESDLCRGDSVIGSSDSNPDSPGSQMELLRAILGRQGERERGLKDTGGFSPDMFEQFPGTRNRKSRMRSHITSKIYVARQTLPELPKKKGNGRGRSMRSKITRTDHP